jgi:hypothetical protein
VLGFPLNPLGNNSVLLVKLRACAWSLTFLVTAQPMLISAIHGLKDLKAGFSIVEVTAVQILALAPGK